MYLVKESESQQPFACKKASLPRVAPAEPATRGDLTLIISRVMRVRDPVHAGPHPDLVRPGGGQRALPWPPAHTPRPALRQTCSFV